MLAIGEIDRAFDFARQYGKEENLPPILGILLAAHEVRGGDFAKAEELLNSIGKVEEITISSTVGSVILPFLKMWVKAGQGHYDEALAYSEEISGTQKEPAPFMYYQRALINDIAGNAIIAEKDYAASVKENIIIPYHFIKAAGNFYERINKPLEAKDLYQRFQKQPPQLGHFSEGIKRINKRQPAGGMVIADAKLGFSEVLKEAVRVAYNNGFYDDGLGYLRLVLYLNPNDEEANMMLASYSEKKNDYRQVVKIYNTKINKKSDFYLASRISTAENLYYQGKKAKAVKMLMKIIMSQQVPNITLLSLADILRKDQKYKEAEIIYSQAIENIKEFETKHWAVFFARGICHERLGNWKESEADLLKALELRPNQPEVLNYLAYSWIDMDKNISEAKNMLVTAVKFRPQDAQILDSMGWVLYKTKDYDSASKFLERAAEFTPYDPVINDHLGDVYWQQGRFSEAKVQWQRVLKFHDGNDDIDLKAVEKKLKKGMAKD